MGMKTKRPRPPYRLLPLAVAAILFAFTLGSCATLGSLFESGEGEVKYALVDEQYVPHDKEGSLTPLPVRNKDGSETGRYYVVAPNEWLPEDAPRFPAPSLPEESSGVAQFFNTFRTGTPVDPFLPVIGLLGAKLLGTKRGRKHTATAMKSVAHLDIGTAMKAIMASDGWLHTEKVAKPEPKVEQAASTG
jgi:hypothetical protein